MTKQEFLIEVTLRLISSRFESETPEDIATKGQWITEIIFGTKEKFNKENGQYWPEDIDTIPIGVVIDDIRRNQYRSRGYAMRLDKIFIGNNIKTVGDLLRMGRTSFKNIKNVGYGSVNRIYEALKNLYDIRWL